MLEPTNFTSAPFSSAGSASPGVGSAESASPASTARITSLLPFSSMISTSRPRFSQKPFFFGMKKNPASPFDANMAWRHFSAPSAARGTMAGAARTAADAASNDRLEIISRSPTAPGCFLDTNGNPGRTEQQRDRRRRKRAAEHGLIGGDVGAR